MATQNKLQKSSDGTTLPHLEDSTVYDDGNVGIGLTNPSYPLHVKRASGADVCALETASGSANLIFKPGGTQAGELTAQTTVLGINANNSGQDLALRTQGINRLVIDSSGKVSIGAATPADLEVTGNVRIASGFLEGEEISNPTNPSSNRGRLYFRDNGGKTELVVLFPSGDPIVIKTEA